MAKLGNYLILSATVFAVVAIAHLIRAIQRWPILVGRWSVPVELSWLAAIVAGALSLWAILLLRERNG
jgi:hypothetical protein